MKDSFSWTKAALIGLVFVILAVWISDQRNRQDVADSVNGIVCVTRPYIQASRERSLQAEQDKTTSQASRDRAHNAVVSSDIFLAGLKTIPRHFNCTPLIAKLTKGTNANDRP